MLLGFASIDPRDQHIEIPVQPSVGPSEDNLGTMALLLLGGRVSGPVSPPTPHMQHMHLYTNTCIFNMH